MIPLAVSGIAIVGVVVAAAVGLLLALFRAEDRYEAEDEKERES
jgi:hypothetical protein